MEREKGRIKRGMKERNKQRHKIEIKKKEEKRRKKKKNNKRRTTHGKSEGRIKKAMIYHI